MVTVRADHGGGPKHVDLIIKGFSQNQNIYLACPEDKPYYPEWQGLPQVKDTLVIPHRKFTLKAFWSLIRFCQKHNIDLVHSHGKGAGLYTRLLKIFFPRVVVIHTFHGIHTGEYSAFKKEVYFFLERIFSRLTDKFINVSKGEQQICLRNRLFKKHQSQVVYNAIPFLDEKARPRPDYLANKFVVVTVSRFDFPKNMGLAFDIASRFKNDPDIVFLWVGDGDDKLMLEEKVKAGEHTNILFTGFSNHVNQYLQWSDLYLSTSKWEGLPYALIEAASQRVPILATNVVGNNEVVTEGENGFLYELQEIEKAVACIHTLSKDKVLHQKLAHNNYLAFLNNFQLEAMRAKLNSLYGNC